MCTKLQDGERKPIAVIIIIIVWQRSLGRSLESQVYDDDGDEVRRNMAGSGGGILVRHYINLDTPFFLFPLNTQVLWKTRISLF